MRVFREFAVGARVVNTAFALVEALRAWLEWHAKGGWKASMPTINGTFGGVSPTAVHRPSVLNAR